MSYQLPVKSNQVTIYQLELPAVSYQVTSYEFPVPS